MDPFLIDNGKRPEEPIHRDQIFWLPADTPYGNFQLKLFKIIERLDEANRQIRQILVSWRSINSHSSGMISLGIFDRHQFSTEQAIYMMRRAADELVSLVCCLSHQEQTGQVPDRIEVDTLGLVLGAVKHPTLLKLYAPHSNLITTLNEIANSLKHSFVNSNMTSIGTNEPFVFALGLKNNKLASGLKFYKVPLSELVSEYNTFYKASLNWLREYSKRNRPSSGTESLLL